MTYIRFITLQINFDSSEYINVLQYIVLSGKLKRNIKQDNVNGMIVSKGFDEIAHDMDELYSKIDRLEAVHEYKEGKE